MPKNRKHNETGRKQSHDNEKMDSPMKKTIYLVLLHVALIAMAFADSMAGNT
jgi:hypothetical protein